LQVSVALPTVGAACAADAATPSAARARSDISASLRAGRRRRGASR